MSEATERGRRAHELLDEFLGPALDAARADYLAAMTQVAASEPWASDKITKLAIAQKVIDLVESHLRAAIASGEVAARNDARAEKVASIPHAKRRWI